MAMPWRAFGSAETQMIPWIRPRGPFRPAELARSEGAGPRGRLGRGLVAVVLVWTTVGTLSVLAASPAGASSPAYTHAAAGSSELRSVACPSATVCEGVGMNSSNQGVVVVVTNGVPGAAQVVPGSGGLSGVACPTVTVCEAVGVGISDAPGVVVTITNGVVTPAQTVPVRLLAVACPTAVTCQAVGSTAEPYYTTGATVTITNGTPAPAQVVPGTFQLVAVACGSATVCEAVGKADAGEDQAAWLAITNGTPGPAAQSFGAGVLRAIACPSANTCQVAGQDMHGEGVVMSIVNGAVWYPHTVFGIYSMSGISCTSASHCQAVGAAVSYRGAVVTVTDSIPSGAQVALHTSTLLGVACSGATCEAVGIDSEFPEHGVVVTVDPTGTAAAASFTYPNWDGQKNVNPFIPFSWSTVPQAQAYYLVVGTRPYGADLASSGVISP
ncbi:MAG: hypothetical protein QOF30_676, partial [Acidimicrobiaceae bacterium]|nr:hypothetical protein [Acidimicrobiaceae bacterium]